jgi:hypothetical protein
VRVSVHGDDARVSQLQRRLALISIVLSDSRVQQLPARGTLSGHTWSVAYLQRRCAAGRAYPHLHPGIDVCDSLRVGDDNIDCAERARAHEHGAILVGPALDDVRGAVVTIRFAQPVTLAPENAQPMMCTAALAMGRRAAEQASEPRWAAQLGPAGARARRPEQKHGDTGDDKIFNRAQRVDGECAAHFYQRKL